MANRGEGRRADLDHPFGGMVGESDALLAALRTADLAATQDAPVLIVGETGTGKGVLARHLHEYSGRRGRFETVNCAAFQPQLVEAQLFGYVKGAFTGADRDTPGILETADKGTLFLDEIGDMALDAQAKLLRVLETGLVRRVGGTSETTVEVRILAATHQDLQRLMDRGQFRSDLFFRINSFVIELPPLRERDDDVRVLADWFLARAVEDGSGNGGATVPQLDESARRALRAYGWPGNVRELESAMRHALAQAGERETITAGDLPPAVQSGRAAGSGRKTATAKINVPPDAADDDDPIGLLTTLYQLPEPEPRQWARFLVAFADHLGAPVFQRADIVAALREVRGPELSDAALSSDWHRKLKNVPLDAGLIEEAKRKIAINLDACRALLDGGGHGGGRAVPDADPGDGTPAPTTAASQTDEPPATSPPPDGARGPGRERRRQKRAPDAYTSFVGRDRELHDLLERLFETPGRLVTVSGPGGIGKTRIALETAHELERRETACAFADLSDARTAVDIALAVAHALDVPISGGDALDAVAGVLEMAGPLVLVLDNFEQVVEHADDTVGRWRDAAPELRLLVTSRAVLGLLGEQEFRLDPLPLPSADAAPEVLGEAPSVRLFVDRARAARPDFALTADNAADVAQLMEALEGLPLAVELAAARTRLMEPRQLVRGLQDALSRWTAPEANRPARQRTIEAVIDWSVDLLAPRERRAFYQLGVFAGGFFLDAAEAVLTGDGDAPDGSWQPLDVLGNLRDKSLVRPMATPLETRFRLYHLLRVFARDRWQREASPAEQDALARRHAEHYADVTGRERERMGTADASEALVRLDLEVDNVFAADDWAFSAGEWELSARLLNGIEGVLDLRGPGDERYRRFARLYRALRDAGDDAVPPDVFIHVANSLAVIAPQRGGVTEGQEAAAVAVAAAEAHGDPALLARCLTTEGAAYYVGGDYVRALESHDRAVEAARASGDPRVTGRALGNRAVVARITETLDLDGAIAACGETIDLFRSVGDLLAVAHWTFARGTLRQERDPQAALADFRTTERIVRELDSDRDVAQSVGQRGVVLANLGQFDEALACLEESGDILRRIGEKRGVVGVLVNRARVHDRLGEHELARDEINEAEQLVGGLNRPGLHAPVLVRQAHNRLSLGDAAGAARKYDDAAAQYDKAGADVTARLCRAQAAEARYETGAARDDGAGMAEELAALRAFIDEEGVAESRLAFVVYRLSARLAAADGDDDAAREFARLALAAAVARDYADDPDTDDTDTDDPDLATRLARLDDASRRERAER